MADKINIAGLDKAEVLAALHNGTRQLGMGALQPNGGVMTAEQAREFIEELGDDRKRMFPSLFCKGPTLRFDYLLGRPLKVDISGDEFDPALYDRDAGQGAAQRAIDALRKAASDAAE